MSLTAFAHLGMLLLFGIALYFILKKGRYPLATSGGLLALAVVGGFLGSDPSWDTLLLLWICPVLGLYLFGITYWHKRAPLESADAFTIKLTHDKGVLTLQNIRRGISIIGAAGSGKTESVLAQLLTQCTANGLSGVLHDYKDFELTEIAYPLISPFRDCSFTVSPLIPSMPG